MPDLAIDLLLTDLAAYLATGLVVALLAARALGLLGRRPAQRPPIQRAAASTAYPRTGPRQIAAAPSAAESEDAAPAKVPVPV